jgi:hypothetical protein
MHNFRSVVGLMAICIGSLAVAHAQQQIDSDYAPNIDFSRYKTYSWQKISAPDSAWENAIRGTVDAQLAAKGWTRVDNGGDAVLCAIANTGEAATLEHFPGGGAPGWRWRGWTEPVSYDQGTLVIDIFDAKTEALIWRGFASQTASGKDQKNVGKLDKVIEKLFKKFPPKQ